MSQMTLREALEQVFSVPVLKGVVSNAKGELPWVKVRFRRLDDDRFQLEKLTQKQAFHSDCKQTEMEDAVRELLEMGFRQLDARSADTAFCVKVSKKGTVTLLRRAEKTRTDLTHNRQKHYLLEEGTEIPPLVDLGVFTKDGKVVQSMYAKFRQINRFTELIRDGMEEYGKQRIRILDFGCGKSYLTFVLYHYLVHIRKMETEIIGLDLKADVIADCNRLAKKYGYDNLNFQVGDIHGYRCEPPPEMVVTLHACDTATDFALFNAVQWGCELIYSVPCCQHELNGQIAPKDLKLLTRYGLIRERFSALATDAIRGALLEACGYRVQMTEFVDMSHSPKNLLIRAVKKPTSQAKRTAALREAEGLMEQFGFCPTLYKMLKADGKLPVGEEENRDGI